MLRRLLSLVALVCVVVVCPRHARAEMKIAVVAVQQAVMQTEEGIRAQATLKKLFDKRQLDIDAKQTELQKAHEDIEKQSRFLSREAFQKRVEDWQRRMLELQNVFIEYQKELAKKEDELKTPIIKKMIGILSRLAKKNGYDMILDKQAAPFVRQDLELTEQVVQMYNSGEPGDASDEAKKPDKK